MPKRKIGGESRTAAQKSASRRNLAKARLSRSLVARRTPRGKPRKALVPKAIAPKHESVGSMSQKAKVAARHGMTVKEFEAKMYADSRKAKGALKDELGKKYAKNTSTYRTKKGGSL